ncbi:YceI family protein [Pseudoalteromonas tunicata]|jgi:polyisoprenoid-binding protein YceI|nr:YceI family protein [Pseudoalteromonas tunicata]ATC93380.1 hypothetical protein PTUN_a0611 [Pseudoalteromonas tunicata]AXT32427.1 YceI family protein [Pseudoalteromonas tunicata]
MLKALLCSALCLSSMPLLAHWQIDNSLSRVNFVSVKKNTIAEVHSFKKVSGEIEDDGLFEMDIDLTSVESLIPIRNDRMQEFLFQTKQFPSLKLSADLKDVLAKTKKGQSAIFNIDATINLHGVSKAIKTEVLLTHRVTGELTVASLMPVIVNAADFGLSAGLDKLQELAGLPSIAQAVPVSFVLTLEKH